MRIVLDKSTVKAGAVEFEVANASTDLMHEFLITPWKGKITGLPYDAKENAVAEDKLAHLQGVEDMPAGAKATIRLVLAPGEYVVFCNQAGHYKIGHGGPLHGHQVTAQRSWSLSRLVSYRVSD